MDPRTWITRLYLSLQREELSLRRQDGQTMAEYGVVLAVITLLIVATLVTLSGAINGKLSDVITALS